MCIVKLLELTCKLEANAVKYKSCSVERPLETSTCTKIYFGSKRELTSTWTKPPPVLPDNIFLFRNKSGRLLCIQWSDPTNYSQWQNLVKATWWLFTMLKRRHGAPAHDCYVALRADVCYQSIIEREVTMRSSGANG